MALPHSLAEKSTDAGQIRPWLQGSGGGRGLAWRTEDRRGEELRRVGSLAHSSERLLLTTARDSRLPGGYACDRRQVHNTHTSTRHSVYACHAACYAVSETLIWRSVLRTPQSPFVMPPLKGSPHIKHLVSWTG